MKTGFSEVYNKPWNRKVTAMIFDERYWRMTETYWWDDFEGVHRQMLA